MPPLNQIDQVEQEAFVERVERRGPSSYAAQS
jgi:hypothetical protein